MAKAGKLLFFDIDDVIFPSTEFSNLARRNALNAMIELGLDADYEKVARKLEEVIREKGSNYSNHFDYLLEKLGVEKEKRARFVAAAVGSYHNTKASIQPYPDAPFALLKLREKYPLYVASEGIAVKQWDKLICMRLALLFSDAFVSEDLGVGKSPGFYRKIAGMVGAKASECVMIGDREEKDIGPAKEAGWKTVRVRRKGAKYSEGKSSADAEIKSLSELAKALEKI
ncbi:MAG: HAD hydrolase-like protein [Candidatus ainarchaeum sp.]|nr:HAD hydrolase-like protein [Candidatus ainarchaeum sp.]